MVIIYDFDGTLTPYGFPQYKILKECGYDEIKLKNRIQTLMKKDNLSLYESYFKVYSDILKENKIPFNTKTVTLGAEEVELSKGLLEYFEDLNYHKTKVRHIVLTSGIKVYISKTPISKYLDEIYGTTFNEKENTITGIKKTVGSEEKPKIIKKISEKYKTKDIIYIGDGLTDIKAFEYTKSIGGISILLSDGKNTELCKDIKDKHITDYAFKRDFRKGKELRNYIEKIIEERI